MCILGPFSITAVDSAPHDKDGGKRQENPAGRRREDPGAVGSAGPRSGAGKRGSVVRRGSGRHGDVIWVLSPLWSSNQMALDVCLRRA